MKNILLAASIFIYYSAFPQSSSTLLGARANSLGYTSSCLTDEWSIFNNTGGLAKIKQTTFGFTYDARPQFQAFNRMAAVVAMPAKFGVAGFGLFRFGDDLYNEQILTGAFSNQFGLASLGMKVNYIQYNIEGFGRKGLATLSFGGIAELTPGFSVGAHIINLNQPKLSEEERLPTILIAGASYEPSDKIFITMEVQKDLDYKPTLKAGLEYKVNPKFIFRTGFNLKPNAGFIGLGFRPKKFSLDYAYSYLPDVSAAHQATVGYRFKQKSEGTTTQ